MPFIVGAPRSGTTLLRLMLDAHPELAIPPETGFIPDAVAKIAEAHDPRAAFFTAVTHYPADAPNWPDFGIAPEHFHNALEQLEPFTLAEGLRLFYRLYAERCGKRRWGDKTPLYGLHAPAIARILPEAHFIHIIRDGRDVVLSWREQWFAPSREVGKLAAEWQKVVSTTRMQGLGSPHYEEVHYERLVADPGGELRRLCRYLCLDFDAAMLRHFEQAPRRLAEHKARIRIDGSVVVSHEQRRQQQHMTLRPADPTRALAWKRTMTAEECAQFEAIAGRWLAELGYELTERTSAAATQ